MSAPARHPSMRYQRGAAALLASVFLIIAVLVMGLVTLRMSATSTNDSLLNHDAAAALYLAETGIERAAGQLAAGTVPCGAGLAGNWTLAGGTIVLDNIGAAFTTGFNGAALPAGQCRVRATGTSGLFSAQRSIEAIIAVSPGNLLGSANANFNNPTSCPTPGTCPPTGWTLPPGGWDDSGGPDGSRAAYVEKPTPGPSTVTTAGQFAMSAFSITAPTTLTLTFDYRLNTSGGGGQRMELTFRLFSGATEYIADAAPFQTSHTGVFQNGSVTFTFPGSGTISIDALAFDMVATGGQPKYGWLDNLVLTGPGTTANSSIIRWRERIL